jgi:hypothetical protein
MEDIFRILHFAFRVSHFAFRTSAFAQILRKSSVAAASPCCG